VALVVAAALPVLSGCASNFSSQVQQPYTPGVGVYDKTGVVEAFNLVIVSGQEGSGTLVASLLNTGDAPDALTGVTARNEDGAPLETQLRRDARLAPDRLVQLHEDAPVTITGDGVRPGYFVEISLQFRDGDTITRQVPVQDQQGPYADVDTPLTPQN